jgi:hypothetical protein
MSNKKRVKFPKYQVFKHTTESKKKNMIGSNPEIIKRKELQIALNPEYFSNTTASQAFQIQYTLIEGKSKPE